MIWPRHRLPDPLCWVDSTIPGDVMHPLPAKYQDWINDNDKCKYLDFGHRRCGAPLSRPSPSILVGYPSEAHHYDHILGQIWARLFLRLSEESSTTSHKNSSKAVHKLKFWSHSHLLIVTSLSVSQYVSDSERGWNMLYVKISKVKLYRRLTFQTDSECRRPRKHKFK